MSELRVNGANIFNTNAVGQTSGRAADAGVTNPIITGGNGSVQSVKIEEKAKRQKELQALMQQKIQEITDNTPKSSSLSDRARMTEDRKNAEKRDREIEQVKAQFKQLQQNLENLSEEEYNKYFQSVFGIEPDEYRMESEQNPGFKVKNPSVDKLKTINATLDNKNNHSAEEIQQKQGFVIQKRDAENKSVKKEIDDIEDSKKNDYGVFKDSCRWFVDHSHLFSSNKNSVRSALIQDENDIEELKQLAQKSDDIAFNTKYKQMTGVDFKVENFEKMEEAQEKYLKNADTKKLVDVTKNLNKKNDNYSLDYFEDQIYDPKNPPEMSPLEKSLFEYFGGKKNSGEAIAKTKEWIRNSSKALGVENADDKTKYEALNKALLDKVEEQKKENPDYKNVKKYKKDYEQSIKDAYGKNIPQEKLNNYVSNVENTYTGLKMAAIAVATSATGGLAAAMKAVNAGKATAALVAGYIASDAGAAALTSFSLNSVEEATDKDGYTVEDLRNNAIEAAETGVGVAVAEAAMVGVAVGAMTISKNNQIKKMIHFNEKNIEETALGIRKTAEPYRESAKEFAEKIAGDAQVGYSSRIKGDFGLDSLKKKIASELQAPHQQALRDAIIEGCPEKAFERIFDLNGVRFLAKDQDGINRIFDRLYSAIEKGEFIPEYINNYCGRGIEPYFSIEQLNKLNELCIKKGYKVKMPCLNPNANGKIFYNDGYTSAHINGRIKVTAKNGSKAFMPTEVQIRTENVQEVFDAIHIPYDVMEKGKNLYASMTTTQKQVSEPIIESFKKLSQNPTLKEQYYEYQTAYIRAKIYNQTLPQPSTYGLPDNLSIENIINMEHLLHAK